MAQLEKLLEKTPTLTFNEFGKVRVHLLHLYISVTVALEIAWSPWPRADAGVSTMRLGCCAAKRSVLLPRPAVALGSPVDHPAMQIHAALERK